MELTHLKPRQVYFGELLQCLSIPILGNVISVTVFRWHTSSKRWVVLYYSTVVVITRQSTFATAQIIGDSKSRNSFKSTRELVGAHATGDDIRISKSSFPNSWIPISLRVFSLHTPDREKVIQRTKHKQSPLLRKLTEKKPIDFNSGFLLVLLGPICYDLRLGK